jgi:hypothetical protein
MTEFIVDTTCGRHFCWSAHDYESLILSLTHRGYTPTFIMPLVEYEALEQPQKERELKPTA